MKGIWAGGLSISFGWLAAVAGAEEIVWRPAGLRPPVAARPVEEASPRSLPVTLGRPIAAASPATTNAPPIVDHQVMRASFGDSAVRSQVPVVRAQQPDTTPTSLPDFIAPSIATTGEAQAASSMGAMTANSGAPIIARTEETQVTPVQGNFVGDALPVPLLPPPNDHPVPPEMIRGAPGRGSLWCDSVIDPFENEPAPEEAGNGPTNRFYGRAEYLLGWIKGMNLPPLVTVSPPAMNGILGPGTTVLFGGNTLDEGQRSGGRFTAGYWLDPCQLWAVEGSFFFLDGRSRGFSASSDQFPGQALARPFFNLNMGIEFSEVTASPNLSTGRIDINSSSRLLGAEANLRRNVCCGCSYRLDLLAGVRYLSLDEDLNIRESIQTLPGVPIFGGDTIFVNDSFSTHNQFYGGQVGANGEWRYGQWFVDVQGKVALGATHEVVNINGSQSITTPQGVNTQFQGGLLALSSNIGHFSRNRFAVVPEVGVNLGYQVTDRVRAFVGYNFLYWSNVVRPADQIDRGLDVTRIPPPGLFQGAPLSTPRPAVLFKSTDFWAQAINFGVEVRY